MDKLISAEKLKKHYAWWAGEDDSQEMQMTEMKKVFDDIIDYQPAVDAKPVIHAEWKLVPCGPMGNPVKKVCTNCGFEHVMDGFDYCPKCGADMRKVE